MQSSQDGAAVVSLRAYARSRAERGLPGNLRAIQKAITDGRIRQAAVQLPGRGGRPEWKIQDPAMADRLWEENRAPDQAARVATASLNPRITPTVPGGSSVLASPVAPVAAPPVESAPAADVTDPIVLARLKAAEKQLSFLNSRADREGAQARIVLAKAAQVEGSTLPAHEVTRQQEEIYRIWRDRMRSLSLRVGRQMALTFSLDQARAIKTCTALVDDFLRDVAKEFDAQAGAAA